MLGIGMVIGVVLGAGVALLVAPGSGADTRKMLSRNASRFSKGASAWNKLGKELRRAAHAKRRSLELEAKRNEIETRRAAKGEATTV